MKVKSKVTGKFATLAAIGALAAVLSLPAAAKSVESAYGTLVKSGYVDREVTLNDGAKYLNVQRNELVKIKVGGKSFVWRFDTLGTPIFKLADIAPADVDAKDITIFVSPSSSDVS